MNKILTFLLVIFSQTIIAQGIIGTPESLILVYNYPDNYFYIELEGKDVRTTKKEGVFLIDQKVVQILTLEKDEFLTKKEEVLSNNEFIKKYIDWEINYIKSSLQLDIKSELKFLKSKKGREFAFWTYEMPGQIKNTTKEKELSPTQKQLFVITRVKDHIVGLYTPLIEVHKFDILHKYLITNIDGIIESDEEINLEELNKKVNK